LQKSLSQPELHSAPWLSGKVVLPQCRPWTKPLSAQPRGAKGSKKRTGIVGTTGTIGTAGIVGTAVGDQHSLSSTARLCCRAFFSSWVASTAANPAAQMRGSQSYQNVSRETVLSD